MRWSQLHLERLVPINPPEGSLWRKVKLPYPTNTPPLPPPPAHASLDSLEDPTSAPAAPHSSSHDPAVAASDNISHPAPTPSSLSSIGAASTADARAVSAAPPPVTFKYWFDLSRTKLGSRLGNLVLLQYQGAERSDEDKAVEYDEKVEVLQASGGGLFTRFTGGVLPGGKYGTFNFSADECKLRNADMLQALVEVYGLQQKGGQ